MGTDSADKVLFGKVLGEVYRLQKKAGVPVPVGDGAIYGLLNGVKEAIDSCIPEAPIDNSLMEAATKVLSETFDDPAKLKAFSGFYDIERDLAAVGVDRGKAIVILTYLYNSGRFTEMLDKMNSTNSPIEVKKFDLSEFDK